MTVEKFFEILELATELDKKLGLQSSLLAVRDALNNLVSAPAQPQHQSNLANAMAVFTDAAEQLTKSITPLQLDSIAELGGAEFFDPSIAENVRASIAENAMTPTVSRDFVKDLESRRADFLDTMKQTLDGLESLGVKSISLEPGNADLAFLIPTGLFENELGAFAKELTFISRLMEHFGEALNGHHEPVILEGLSSSVPFVAIAADLGLIMYLAKVVNKFLEAWERVEKIRKIRAEIAEMGIEGAPIEVLTKQIAETVRTVVTESVNDSLANYTGEVTRKNELETALRQGTRRLFGQIERGLTIQFRAAPKKDASEAESLALETVAHLGREMKFPQPEAQPLLLETGEILEGDIQEKVPTRAGKKSTAHKSTTKQVVKAPA